MSLLKGSMRPPPVASEEAVRRYVDSIRAELEPDPLFRRRLRGAVTNRFVAARETADQPARIGSYVGRLGRACLYGSVALAVSVGGTMAASRGSVPGDLLYPVKLQIEALRMRALPAEFHDELALYALGARVRELGVLAERGHWDALPGAAAAVEAAYAEVERLGAATLSDPGLAPRVEVLESLLQRLPEEAHAAIRHALDQPQGSSTERAAEHDPRGTTSGASTNGRVDGEAPRTVPGGDDAPPTDTTTATPKPTPSTRGTPSPNAGVTSRPATARPSASPTSSEPDSNVDGERDETEERDD